MPLFRNFYRCDRCGNEWEDVWSATCDDDCPSARGTCHLISRKMPTTIKHQQPFGAVSLLSRHSGCPVEVVIGAQAFHKKDSTKNAGD